MKGLPERHQAHRLQRNLRQFLRGGLDEVDRGQVRRGHRGTGFGEHSGIGFQEGDVLEQRSQLHAHRSGPAADVQQSAGPVETQLVSQHRREIG